MLTLIVEEIFATTLGVGVNFLQGNSRKKRKVVVIAPDFSNQEERLVHHI